METAKKLARAILIHAEKKEQFSVFCDCMVSKRGAACTLDGSLKKHSSRRERMWQSFHSLCVNELPPMWKKFIADTAITDHDVDDSSLVVQHVNLKIFEGMLKRYTRIEQVESEIILITQDEANALRYAAGHVPFILKKRFSKRPEIVAFLSSVGKEGVESSFLEYTKEWINQVNWGGLFQINDCLFVEIEMKLRRHLLCLFKTNTNIKKEDV